MTADAEQNVRFRLLVNGEVKGIAGLPSFGVLTQTLSWLSRDPDRFPRENERKYLSNKVSLRLGGLDTVSKEFVEWYECELHAGDEFTIQILPQGEFDRPAERKPCSDPTPQPRRQVRSGRSFRGPAWRKVRS
jgi:hypothetical protein